MDDPALGKRTYHEQHFFCAECGDPFLAPSPAKSRTRGAGSSPIAAGGGGGANPNEISIKGDGAFDVALNEDGAEVGFTVYRGHPYCEACHVRLRAPKCKACKRSIRDGARAVEALGGKWCFECFVCAVCVFFLSFSLEIIMILLIRISLFFSFIFLIEIDVPEAVRGAVLFPEREETVLRALF